MSNSNNQKPVTKVTLSSNVQSLVNGVKADLVFTFSSIPNGFTLNDVFVKNGVLTNLVQDLQNPNIFRADFIGGTSDRSGMSNIQLTGSYFNDSGVNGTPSNTLTIKNLEAVKINTIEPTVGFTKNNLSVLEGDSGFTDMDFVVSLSSASDKYITVNYTTNYVLSGTASVLTDYTAIESTVVFAPGETTKTVSVQVIGDKTYEANENLYLNLTSATGASIVTNNAEGLRSSWATGTIINDDVAPKPTVGFVCNNSSTVEGNSGVTAMNFTVKLSNASTEDITVNYTTNQKLYGTAKAGIDFTAVTGNIVFAAGETTKTISVNILGDKVYEANETFYVDLTSATGASIVTNGAEGLKSSWAIGTIINDDSVSIPTVGFTKNNSSVVEGNSGLTNMNFTLQLNSSSTQEITVSYTTQLKTFGTAKTGLDFVSKIESVVFAPGETTKTISVAIIGDSTYEANETFYVDITSAKGASIVTNGAEGLRSSWAVGSIVNDDVLSVITTTPNGIYGTTSKDIIGGTANNDFIYGKGGSDIITGFSGNDTFVFSKINSVSLLSDAAQITDFKDNFDKIGLSNLTFNDLNIFQGSGVNVNNTIVALSSGETLVTLMGVNSNTINISDFIVV